MKDPGRMLDGGATQVELALLRAGASEQPSEASRQRLLVALGLPLAVSSPAASAGAEGGGGATVASVGGKLGVSWLVAMGGSVALGVAVMVYRAVEPREHAPTPIAAPAPGAATGTATGTGAGTRTATQLRATAPQQSTRTRPASRSIAREITRLDEVRDLLARGEPRAALAALARYGAQHPAGVLRQEAALLRIEALASTGDRASAQRLAQRFLRENPGSPHARRIRALAGGSADVP